MTPIEYAATLDQYDFEYFKSQALDHVPDGVDKREGSIIYDALAPSAYAFAEMVIALQRNILDSYTQTATGEYLDYRGEERGLTRYQATKAVVTAKFLDSQGANTPVEIGDRFASIGASPYFYAVSKLMDDGTAQLTAEVAGDGPNHYLGQILPISPNDQVAYAEIIEMTIPARNTETDDDYRQRILNDYKTGAYGGNIADYQDMIASLGTVGAVQVYPTWEGGGTVKLVILDNDEMPASQQLQTDVKLAIDPADDPGQGIGMAPIGHEVTVVAPTARTIPITMTVQTETGSRTQELVDAVTKVLSDYFESVRHNWAKLLPRTRTYSLMMYRAQMIVAVLAVPGVVNVTDLLIDGQPSDLKLTETAELSELPVLGEVTING
ncbi:baseplate J/gp47 family protein [Lacticaseibacillus saniviri]|uniref:Uncharacterized protein n=1 Tax=Lacticaseibacillus saniviri JCM 17471 = DSM 24301 TaxID=1293598 RepID=A0A0R2MSR7_9LACO|nr:baseplate J/gp47 family protein [Lacticaseibacillus saniviri]KRO16622.1 hypothetical protein IV56_GL001066 [Lacticaseibacillus saniviri JCM 17471 = DSM 24301]